MIIRSIILLCVLFLTGEVFAQEPTPDWVKHIGGSEGQEFILAMDVDESGNIYLAGGFEGTVEFNYGGAESITKTAAVRDAFFAKYDPSGNCIWVKCIETTDQSEIKDIKVNSNGIYVAGLFSGTADFYTGETVGNLTSAGGFDLFYGKYDLNGNALWVHRHGDEEDDGAYALDLDLSGDVYVAGYFAGTIDVDPSNTATVSRTASGLEDIFLGKFTNANGDMQWVHTMGSTGYDGVFTLDVDNNNQVIIGGYFSGAIDFDPMGSTPVFNTNSETYAACLVNYDQTGSFLWAGVLYNNSTGTYINSVATDVDGNIYVAGRAYGSVDFDFSESQDFRESGYTNTAFLARYDVSSGQPGTADWVNLFGSGYEIGINWLSANSQSVMATGYFADAAVDFDPSGAEDFRTNWGLEDAFLASYDAITGSPDFTRTYGSDSNDSGLTIKITNSNVMYTAGYFAGTVSFEPGYEFTSLGGVDGYFSKYVPYSVTEPVAQPTNFNYSSITSSGFTVSFTEATDTPDGYLAVRKSGSKPNFTPIDGTQYTIGSPLPSGGFVAYIGNAKTFTETGLPPATTFHYEIFSYNGTGSSIDFNSFNALEGSVTTAPAEPVEPQTQPQDLTINSVTENSVNYSFLPAPDGADGYIAVGTLTSQNWSNPIDGTSYSVGDQIGNGFVFSIGNNTTNITTASLEANTSYTLRIYSFNGSASTSDFNVVEPLTGEFTTTGDEADLTPPVITHSAGGPVEANTQITINAQIADDESGIALAEVYYTATESAAEYEDFKHGTMANEGGTSYTFNIPASEVKGMSVTYYLYAKNGAGLEKWTPEDFVRLISVPATGLQIPFNTFGVDQADYRIISFPIIPTNNSVASVIGDELGPKDDAKWRMFHYSNGNTQQLNPTSSIQLGKGYWLIAKDRPSASFTTGPGSFPNASISNPFAINLTSGWNQIGNPYNFDVSWEAILEYNENPSQIVPNLKVFKGSWTNGNELEKFSGGFVFSNSNLTLEIPPYKDTSINGRKKSGKPKRPIDQPDWEVDLTLKAGALNFDLAGFGMNTEAKADFDVYDDINLPAFLDYAQVSHTKKINSLSYSRDIVPTAEDHVWEFVVESNAAGDDGELAWDNLYFGAGDKQLILWDASRNHPIDMRGSTTYRFKRSQSGLFRIFYGSRDFIREQVVTSALSLYNASPNPSQGAVAFSFSIPESGASQNVALEVFDLLGRKVATVLNDNLDPGFYITEWNGLEDDLSRPAAGVYLTLLRSGNSTDLCRIILK